MSTVADPIAQALGRDRTIDIVTTGARTGRRRSTEIWYHRIDGQIVICGRPSAAGRLAPRQRRDWLANLKACPEFDFCLKESVQACLTARARVVAGQTERHRLMSAPQVQWYRDQGFTVEDLALGAPIVDVRFTGKFAYLNDGSYR